MARRDALISTEQLDVLIYEARGQKVMLDADLARIYGVPTKVLNQAVKRNASKFPNDFVFRLTAEEVGTIRCQIGAGSRGSGNNRSQFVTGSQKHRDPRYLPFAFTEHGAIMAANVLNSPRAVEMSVFVVASVREDARATDRQPRTVQQAHCAGEGTERAPRRPRSCHCDHPPAHQWTSSTPQCYPNPHRSRSASK